MSKNSTSAKSLKGYLLALDNINIGNLTVDTITAVGDLGESVESLYDTKITNSVIESCYIDASAIGFNIPTQARFTKLDTDEDVTFSSNVQLGLFTREARWQYEQGILNIKGDLKVTENANLGNLKIYNNTIETTNGNGNIILLPNTAGRIFLTGAVNIDATTGNFNTNIQNGNVSMISSEYIRLLSQYAGTTISSFSDQLYSCRNGDINIYTDTGIISKNITNIIATSGNIRITSSTNTDLRQGDSITISSSNSNPNLNGVFTVKSILNRTSFFVDTTTASLITSGNTGSFLKLPSNNINLASNNINLASNNDINLASDNNINLASKNFITIPQDIKLTFGITNGNTVLNSIHGNTSGLYLNSTSKIIIPQTILLQIGTSGSNYINFDGSSLNLNSYNGVTISGSLTQINSPNTRFSDMNLTIGDITVTSGSTDRGIEYRYYSTSGSMKMGWFGVKASTGQFTFISDATNSNDVISGNIGNFNINTIQASVITLVSGGTLTATNINSTNITTSNIYANGIVSSSSLYCSNSTITNIVHTNISTGTLSAINVFASNVSAGKLYAFNATATNLVAIAASTGSLNASGMTTSSLLATGLISAANLFSSNISAGELFASNVTSVNMVASASSTGSLDATGVTTSALLVTGLMSAANIFVSNVSAGKLFASSTTTVNLASTAVSTGSLDVNGVTASNLLVTSLVSAANLFATNISTSSFVAATFGATDMTVSNLIGTNTSIANIVNTNMTSATIYSSDIYSTNVSSANMYAVAMSTDTLSSTGLASLNSITTGSIDASGNVRLTGDLFVGGTVTAVNVTSVNLIQNNISTGTLIASGASSLQTVTATNVSASTLDVTGITTSTLLATSLISAANLFSTNVSVGELFASNATTVNLVATAASAGSLDVGGVTASSLLVTSLISGSIFAPSINTDSLSSGHLNTNSITSGTLLVTNIASFISDSNTLGSIFTTGGNVGIGIVNPVATLDIVGGIKTTLGITAESIYVSNMTSTANLSAINASIGSIVTSSISSGQINVNGGLYSSMISTGNIQTLMITANNLHSNLVSSSNLYSLNITSASLTAITFDSTYGQINNIECDNLTINTEFNSKGLNNMNTLNIRDHLNVNGSAIGSISNLVTTNITASSINTSNFTASNINFTGNLYKNGILYDPSSISSSNSKKLYQTSYILNNSVSLPSDIPDFSFDTSVKSFISYIYVSRDDTTCGLYTVNGMYDGNEWILSYSFIGDKTDIKFYIRTDTTKNGIIQYTNENTTGTNVIKYWTSIELLDTEGSLQFNITLSNDITSFTDIGDPELIFDTTSLNAVKLIMYISDESSNSYGIYFLNCILKDTIWVLNVSSVGKVPGIEFFLTSSGVLQYKNINTVGTYIARSFKTSLLKSQTEYPLLKNTSGSIDTTNESFIFKKTQNSFNMNVHVQIPFTKYALYEINGYICNDIWYINYSFIGDNTNIDFYIDTINGDGILKYINSNSDDAIMKYILNSPLIYKITDGYTGNTYFISNAILCGNGTDPIIGSSSLVFEDNKLILSDEGSLIVNEIDITPSIGDITREKEFNALNNQLTNADVTNFSFTNINIKSFTGIACVTITTTTTTYDALYELKGLNKNNGWNIYSSNIGDNVGITFYITSSGQITYTSTNISNWVSTKIKFRAMTTTV
jgi:hypothetical protein